MAESVPRVLIIDDTKDILVVASALIQSLGAQPFTAESGKAGIELVYELGRKGTPIDLIMLDIRMPEMDGNAAAQELRAQGYTGKIIVFTANPTMQGKKKSLSSGVDGYLGKTVMTKDVLAALLSEHCGFTPKPKAPIKPSA